MNWLAHLWRECSVQSWRSIAPAFAAPDPLHWDDSRLTAAWLSHSTVLINFFGVTLLTDPLLFRALAFASATSPSDPSG